MTEPLPFEPRRFQSAARHYHARPAYSPRIFARVAALFSLGPADRVMDLGCGPGTLALGLAPYAGHLLAVDPEPDMLLVAEEAVGEFAGKVTLVEGSSNDLGPHFGRFRLVVMGRSFHWMDRVETLQRLDALIEPDGAIILFDTKRIRGPDSRWYEECRGIVERYAAANGPVAWREPDWIDHEAILLDSAFANLERISVFERERIAAESLVDRALSMSRSTPEALGQEKAEAMVRDIRAFVGSIAEDGALTEILETTALIARRT